MRGRGGNVFLAAAQKILHRWDPVLLGLLLLLFGWARVVMTSAAPDRLDDQLFHQGVAFATLLLAAWVPFRAWLAVAPLLYGGGILLLLLVMWVGVSAKGATRWLDFGVVRVQPSELMKLAVPLMVAAYFHWRRRTLSGWDYWIALGWVLLPVGLIIHQPDLGTGLMVAMAGAATLFFAGLRWRWIIPWIAAAAVGVTLLMIHGDSWCQPEVEWPGFREYQKARVCTLLDPYRDPLGKGFHTIQAEIAIGSGGLWGKGIGQGTQSRLNFVPERHTDFILAVIAEEMGLVGVAALFGAYFLMLTRALFLAMRSGVWAGQLYGAAAVAGIFLYVWVNAAMVTGMTPVVGVPLPFVSYGGTALMSACLMLGVVLSAAAAAPSAAQRWGKGQIESGSSAYRSWPRGATIWALLIAAVLAGCSSTPPQTRGRANIATPPAERWVDGVVPRVEPLRAANARPYTVLGRTYVPMTDFEPYVEEGIASWYGREFHGKPTATGERYDMFALSAAHKTLPLPSYARVTNLENGRQVVVRVNDRGPFVEGRLIDLSFAAADRLGFANRGTALVRVELILPEEIRLMAARRGEEGMGKGESGEEKGRITSERESAEREAALVALLTALAGEGRGAFLEAQRAEGENATERARTSSPSTVRYFVQLGAFALRENAENFVAHLRVQLPEVTLTVMPAGGLTRVVAGPFGSEGAARRTAELVTARLGAAPFVFAEGATGRR
ncbi:MAG: rod shape-determining protein RodA [Hydrogenophilus sp.]|nr:rod shape-determining protein RodA [Hydrogenophilus sp.]